jgi:hypothetical protein
VFRQEAVERCWVQKVLQTVLQLEKQAGTAVQHKRVRDPNESCRKRG